MKKYLIYACESQYGGLHGMEDWTICECNSYEEACEIGHEMSYEVITSYSSIIDGFEEEAHGRLIEEGITVDDADYDDLYDDWMNDLIEEDIEYSVYELQEEIDYDTLIKDDTNWEDIRDKYSIDNKGE